MPSVSILDGSTRAVSDITTPVAAFTLKTLSAGGLATQTNSPSESMSSFAEVLTGPSEKKFEVPSDSFTRVIPLLLKLLSHR